MVTRGAEHVSKTRREGGDVKDEDVFYELREELEDIVYNNSNKISKTAEQKILELCATVENGVTSVRLQMTEMKGKLDYKE